MPISVLFALVSHTAAVPPYRIKNFHRTPVVRTAAHTAHSISLPYLVLVPAIPAPRPVLTSGRLLPMTAPVHLSLASTEEIEEQELIADINRERHTHGLSDLVPDPLLGGAARSHSREMCGMAYFDHHSPSTGMATPMDRYFQALQAHGEGRPDTALVGENIFYASITNTTYNAQYAHEALMHSPGHRANILEPRFSKVGVGVYRDSKGRFWVTEMFLRDN